MQTVPDERPSLARMLSCRHSKKVSCETLSINDVFLHDHLPFEAQSFSFSDGGKDVLENDSSAGDADESINHLANPNSNYCNLAHEYLQHARELENSHSGKLDNPSYGDCKAAGDNFLSRFFSKVSHMPAASRAKEVERLRKHLRKHPGAIHHTSGVLPHSGPILWHIGSYSGAPSSKAPATLRASSIIPRNAVADKMNASAGEPFSPKVNCLGSVRNKQKHLGKCASVTSNHTNENQVSVCCTLVLSRRMKKKAPAQSSKKEKKASGKAMVGDHHLAQSKKTDREKALKHLTAQRSGGTGSLSSRFVAKEESKTWSLREIKKHGECKVSHQNKESWQESEASAAGGFPSEFSVDLSRFGSESQRRHALIETSLVTSLVGNGSQRFEQDDQEGSVQAPLQNALFLIRSRKANDQPSEKPAASTNVQETSVPEALDDCAMIKTAGTTQSHMPTSSVHTHAEDLLPLPEVEMKKPATIADILGNTSSHTTQGASATECKCEEFEKRYSLPTEHLGGHMQASLLKPYPEVSIWQRRPIEKPCALDIKRPIIKLPVNAELNRRTTM